MKISDTLLREFSNAAGLLHAKGWAEGGSGNISKRIPLDTPTPSKIELKSIEMPQNYNSLIGQKFLFTLSGSRMRHIAESPEEHVCFAQIDHSGKFLEYFSENGKPTGEYLLHLELYNRHSSINAIVHTHTPVASILPCILSREEVQNSIFHAHTEIPWILPKGIDVVGLIPPCSFELALEAGMRSVDTSGLIIEKHGSIGWGEKMDIALDRIEVIEKGAYLTWMLHVSGTPYCSREWEPSFLPPESQK